MQAFFETYAGAHMEAARSRTEVLAEVIPLLQRVGCFARLTRGKRFGRIIGWRHRKVSSVRQHDSDSGTASSP